MQKLGIRAKMNKRFKIRKKVIMQTAPNLLDRNFQASEPNRVWVSDITYIKTQEGWIYLAALVDLFSRKVVGWAIEDHMKVELIQNALKNALLKREPVQQVIHHYDRGSQYTSESFRKLCEKHGVIQSMGNGSCFDNAAMESFFHTIKTELIYLNKLETKQQARSILFEYIEGFYNRKRAHFALDYSSPEEYEIQFKKLAVQNV